MGKALRITILRPYRNKAYRLTWSMRDGSAFYSRLARSQLNAPSGWIGVVGISGCNALVIDLPGRRLRGTLRPSP
jgi:hypothetical protein